jgi:hypothetical protein
MTRCALRHAFFTNAPGPGGAEGYRMFYEPPRWEGPDHARLARWLEGLTLEPSAGSRGWAANAFRLAGTIHACLVAVDGAFGPDRHGRGRGHLAHLVAVPGTEGSLEVPYLPDLWKVLRGLARPEGEAGDLDNLTRRAAAVEEVETDDGRARLADLACLDATFLGVFLQASAGAGPGEVVSFPVPAGRDLDDLLLRAGGALPPRLRLGVRWVLHLVEGTEAGFVVREASAGRLADVEPRVAGYRDWLCRTLEVGDTVSIRRVTGDWEIRSWDHLMERVS